jgi:chemotaxis protein MotD
MNKLNGTTGQLFATIAESINTRGIGKSGKSSTGQTKDDSSFHDLLHTVSNMAKRALNDQEQQPSVKPATLRARMAQLPERDESKDEPVRESRAAEEKDTSNSSAPSDPTAKTDVQSRLVLPSIVGQELAAVPGLKSQPQPSGGDTKAAPSERVERSIGSANSQGPTVPVDSGARPAAAAPQATTAQGSAAASTKGTSTEGGFQTVAADIERVAKLSGREALPEATKVTVLQQETHLPPVPQFTATQQVANAVVSELKGTSAASSSAAPDLMSTQGNTPDQPIKMLTISLDPPALGNVTVRLRLAGDTVSVHLAADRRDTSQMLDQQRDSIRDLMQSAGYVADVAPVQHGSLDGSQAGAGQSQSSFTGQQQSSNPQGTSDGFTASSGQSQGEAGQSRQERNPNQETRHEQNVVPGNGRGAVYL